LTEPASLPFRIISVYTFKWKENGELNSKRRAGILLPVFSLPSRYGIGCFDSAAYRFVDFLCDAGQSEWQILPLGPTGYGDSPYQSFSSYAGNPYFVSLEALVADGLLSGEDCENAELEGGDGRVDYGLQYARRLPLLRMAFERFSGKESPEFTSFCKNNPRVMEYALFMAIKDRHGGAPWNEWERELRFREPSALAEASSTLSREIGFYAFLQYRFFSDFERLHAYAREKGISLIGDLPIYVSYDSADVWASPAHFCLDAELLPTAVAGCPPDGFSPSGQLWGNPLYRWEVHEKEGYAWWVSRIREAKRLCDTLRIDHFRGFDAYYAIPYGAPDAREGRWEKGPGIALFRALSQACGELDVIVEDLGFIDDSVRTLVRQTGFPNMRVLEFGFDVRDDSAKSEHLPHNYPRRCVAYLGTHDNETIVGWFEGIKEEERQMAREYLCDPYTPANEIHKPFVSVAMLSNADTCIIPIQDYMGLDNSCRMNQPSTVGKNWRWRLEPGQVTEALGEELAAMAKRYGRMNWAAVDAMKKEEKLKAELKAKLKAEIKAELEAEEKAEKEAEEKAEAAE
jgi:4-alpha-glucanotransferase